jgi:hypothetical protein
MGKGCWPVGFPMPRPTFVSINRCLGEVSGRMVAYLCDVS